MELDPSGVNEAPVDFEYLSANRKLLREFCRFHIPALEYFAAKDFPIFRLIAGAREPDKFRHITSTATCYSSLDLYPKSTRPKSDLDFDSRGKLFAAEAIKRPLDEWKSDDAARVYCTCRGLPYVLSRLEQWHPNIDAHLDRIYYQLKVQPTRFAIGEAAPPARSSKSQKKIEKHILTWYKPNAYHTYWTLEILKLLRDEKFEAGRTASASFQALSACENQMRLWARQQLGFQVALHSGDSSRLDTDQLAWSLAIIFSQPDDYQSNLSEQDFIRKAIECLFQTQEKVGTWRHYAPLFHYPSVGNAYCYVFETFTTLLTLVLKPEAAFLRDVLRKYAPRLLDLWTYANSTRAEISGDAGTSERKEYGWSSGHRISTLPESWATASVFAYAQALRSLIGVWTREEALKTLNHKVKLTSKDEAIRKLRQRVSTWTHPDLADLLGSMFINPLMGGKPPERCDPDEPLFENDVARSAIFFGPPGTGKTSLVSSLAGALGWTYIEIHPSHFVSEGLPNVQHTADGIFGKLMELDHAVVLFDEIDEMVREREIEPDQFGRFLTTSMLPRLGELWKARKIMYFVGTNHIEYFDRAITRSERFDAIIFLSPPSFDKKRDRILEILKDKYSIDVEFSRNLNKAKISAAMPRGECEKIELESDKTKRDRVKSEPLPPENVLSKFALVRWDELNDIALHLSDECRGKTTITPEVLGKALKKVRDNKSRGIGEYCRFDSDPDDYEWFDSSRNASWVVKNSREIEGDFDPLPEGLVRRDNFLIVQAPIGSKDNIRLSGYQVQGVGSRGNRPVLGIIALKSEQRKESRTKTKSRTKRQKK